MKVKVKVYNGSKYSSDSKVAAEVEYAIADYEVKKISDNEIYQMGFDDVDPFGEYLILKMEDGETSTFRNSLCDMFVI